MLFKTVGGFDLFKIKFVVNLRRWRNIISMEADFCLGSTTIFETEYENSAGNKIESFQILNSHHGATIANIHSWQHFKPNWNSFRIRNFSYQVWYSQIEREWKQYTRIYKLLVRIFNIPESTDSTSDNPRSQNTTPHHRIRRACAGPLGQMLKSQSRMCIDAQIFTGSRWPAKIGGKRDSHRSRANRTFPFQSIHPRGTHGGVIRHTRYADGKRRFSVRACVQPRAHGLSSI